MYTDFFRLRQSPFSIAPDPRYVYMSERHREALAHLLYGVNGGGGFVLLTGEIGAGKTTICRCFLEQVPENCNVAYIFNPKLSATELLRTICEEFRVDLPPHDGSGATPKDYVDALNRFLLAAHAAGRNNVLIIDEAQNLSADVLEQLRLLTNLETSERKLLQIILIGQPELRAMLAQPALEQLAQRIIARYHLDALSQQETAGYIAHRLAVAGLASASPFRPNVIAAIHRATAGVPRRINLLCDRALLGAYAENRAEVDRRIVARAAAEVFGLAQDARAGSVPARVAIAGIAGALVLAAAAVGWQARDAHMADTAAVAATRPLAAPPVAAKPAPATDLAVRASLAPAASGSAADSRDARAGMRRLARLWQADLAAAAGDATDPCAAAQALQLHCYRSNAGFAELRQLDRPALLTLRDDAGQPYYALLTGLTATEARLDVGAEQRSVSLVELARHFDGAFVTLWRAPHDFRQRLAAGQRGAEVDWLAQQLARVHGRTAPAADASYDDALREQVRAFQFSQGLRVDGMAGPRTIMQLNRASGVDEPVLTRASAGGK